MLSDRQAEEAERERGVAVGRNDSKTLHHSCRGTIGGATNSLPKSIYDELQRMMSKSASPKNLSITRSPET